MEVDDFKPMEKKIFYKCSKCDTTMEDTETWLRLSPKDQEEPVYVYCRPCVEATPELQEQADHMCRVLVMEILLKSTEEERAEMKELMQKEQPDDYKLIADLFEVKPFEVISMEQVVPEEEKVVADQIPAVVSSFE